MDDSILQRKHVGEIDSLGGIMVLGFSTHRNIIYHCRIRESLRMEVVSGYTNSVCYLRELVSHDHIYAGECINPDAV